MLELIKDISQFMWERKQYWIVPVIISVVLVAILIIFGGSAAVTPFVYSIF
jgi:hypothetical protein